MSQPTAHRSPAINQTSSWSRRLHRTILSLLLLTLLLTATASAAPVNRKLSGTMPAFGEVFGIPSAQISPDSQL